jgi:hypothetical protein
VSAPAVAAKAEPVRPFYSETLLEIPRSETCRLIVELVRWDATQPPVVKLLVMSLGKQGVWYVNPGRASIRLDECRKVARALVGVKP